MRPRRALRAGRLGADIVNDSLGRDTEINRNLRRHRSAFAVVVARTLWFAATIPRVPPWLAFLLLAAAGFVSSVINTLAGGGSFLTLPLLIFLGMPAAEANGTNRLGVVAQNVAAVWAFHGVGVLDWRVALRAAVPATVASVFGAWLALHVGEREFRRILALVMVAITLWTLLEPLVTKRLTTSSLIRTPRPGLATALFVVAGFYGGFVQAGVGFLVLAATTLAGLDLVRGNAVKVLVILLVTIAALGLFAWDGKVRWAGRPGPLRRERRGQPHRCPTGGPQGGSLVARVRHRRDRRLRSCALDTVIGSRAREV